MMSPAAVGGYISLLCQSWETGPLPDDPQRLSMASGLGALWPDFESEILAKFQKDENGNWVNPRLEKERETRKSFRDSLSDAGRRGAEKRWGKNGHPNGHSNGHPNGEANGEANGLGDGKTTTTTTVQKKNKGRGTREEIIEDCISKGLIADDGEWLFDKWEGSGWKNGGQPIKCWKSTVSSWKRQGYFPSQKQNGNGSHKPHAAKDYANW